MGLVYSQPACRWASSGDLQRLYSALRDDSAQLNVQEPISGDTPLIAACRRGNLRVVEYLLDNRADAQLTNQKQRTCLHYVSKRTISLIDYLLIAILMPILLLGYFLLLQKQRKSVSLMEAVLSSDVNIDAVDNKGNTALHYVCLRKSQILVPLLLERHADTNIQNNDGETALDVSIRLKFRKIVNLLKKER